MRLLSLEIMFFPGHQNHRAMDSKSLAHPALLPVFSVFYSIDVFQS